MLSDKPKEEKGKFIVIDGIDGSGKTTQIELLAIALRTSGLDVIKYDFPQYGQKSAGPIEEYLSGKYGNVNPEVASLFFAVDRFDAGAKLKEAVNAGECVLTNRYVTSSAGHQGGKIDDHQERNEFFRWLNNLEYEIFGIPKPDLTIVLHVDAVVAQELSGHKYKGSRKFTNGHEKDLHEKDLDHLKRAEKIFLEIPEFFPNTKLVECMENGKLLPPLEVHNRIWNLVQQSLFIAN
jgi:dTMP kinase